MAAGQADQFGRHCFSQNHLSMQSLWDRLIIPESKTTESPELTASTLASVPLRLEVLLASVREDLNRLLNTRRAASEAEVESVDQIDRSLLSYGIPEFENFNPGSASHCNTLARRIQKAIERFEPRLDSVEVRYWQADQNQSSPNVHLRIRARLVPTESVEAVRFDTEFDLSTLEFEVKK